MTVPAFAGIGVSIDGVPVHFTAQSGKPVIDENNRTLVPLRAAMEAFGCSVSWNEPTKTALVAKGNTLVSVPVGQSILYKDGITIQNDTAAKIIDGRVYLPIRAVLEAFGASVGWDNAAQAVSVTTQAKEEVFPAWHDLKDLSANTILINGSSYHCSPIQIATYPLTHNDLWIDLYNPDSPSESISRYSVIATNQHHINTDNGNIEFPRNASSIVISSVGTNWEFSYDGKTLIFPNVTHEGNYNSEGVRMVVYSFDDNSLGAYINATELGRYFNFPLTGFFTENTKTLFFS